MCEVPLYGRRSASGKSDQKRGPHQADTSLFLNVGVEGHIQNLYEIGHVSDAETIGDNTITTQCQLRPSSKKVHASLGWELAEQLLHRNVRRFRDGLVFKAHRRVYHSALGLRVIKKKKKGKGGETPARGEMRSRRWLRSSPAPPLALSLALLASLLPQSRPSAAPRPLRSQPSDSEHAEGPEMAEVPSPDKELAEGSPVLPPPPPWRQPRGKS